jgi:hypothetical protein
MVPPHHLEHLVSAHDVWQPLVAPGNPVRMTSNPSATLQPGPLSCGRPLSPTETANRNRSRSRTAVLWAPNPSATLQVRRPVGDRCPQPNPLPIKDRCPLGNRCPHSVRTCRTRFCRRFRSLRGSHGHPSEPSQDDLESVRDSPGPLPGGRPLSPAETAPDQGPLSSGRPMPPFGTNSPLAPGRPPPSPSKPRPGRRRTCPQLSRTAVLWATAGDRCPQPKPPTDTAPDQGPLSSGRPNPSATLQDRRPVGDRCPQPKPLPIKDHCPLGDRCPF